MSPHASAMMTGLALLASACGSNEQSAPSSSGQLSFEVAPWEADSTASFACYFL